MEILRREESQSLGGGSHHQNLKTTSRSGASENLSEIQQPQHEREHLTDRSLEAQVAQNPG